MSFDDDDDEKPIKRGPGRPPKTPQPRVPDPVEFSDDPEFLRFEVRQRENIIRELRAGHGQALQHVERMFLMLEKPLSTSLRSMENMIEKLNAREEAREQTHLEMMRVLGEVLLHKDERAALAAQSQQRAQTFGHVAQVAVSQIPKLMEQMSGGNELKKFVSSLNDEQREGLMQLTEAFEGEQREQLQRGLAVLGLKNKPAQHEPAPVVQNGTN